MTDLARFTGNDALGDPGFEFDVRVPNAARSGWRASPSMMESVARFLGCDIGEISDDQAHVILCVRDYAKVIVEHLNPRARRRVKVILTTAVGVFILSNDLILPDVKAWSERRFNRGSDSAAIRRTKHFAAVDEWLGNFIQASRVAGANW